MASNTAPVVDRIRIIPRPDDFLDRNVGASGEVFYDKQANTLRLYSGKQAGGFSLLTAGNLSQQLADAGADVLVAGSYVFKSENPTKTITDLKALLAS